MGLTDRQTSHDNKKEGYAEIPQTLFCFEVATCFAFLVNKFDVDLFLTIMRPMVKMFGQIEKSMKKKYEEFFFY